MAYKVKLGDKVIKHDGYGIYVLNVDGRTDKTLKTSHWNGLGFESKGRIESYRLMDNQSKADEIKSLQEQVKRINKEIQELYSSFPIVE